MKQKKTPQLKKEESYKKDRGNSYGESPHGSRSSIPENKSRVYQERADQQATDVSGRQLMYIENKTAGTGLDGPARIGWVTFSKSKRSFYYAGRTLKRVGDGYKYNCIDAESGDRYWVSGPKVRGGDKMYGGIVEIDEDAREEYWINFRNLPHRKSEKKYRG